MPRLCASEATVHLIYCAEDVSLGLVGDLAQSHDSALKAARDLKSSFPRLQVKVYDAQKKQSETVEMVAA